MLLGLLRDVGVVEGGLESALAREKGPRCLCSDTYLVASDLASRQGHVYNRGFALQMGGESSGKSSLTAL